MLKQWFLRVLTVLLLTALLYWALRNAPLGEILASLRLLTLAQIGWLLALNSLIFVLITLRWWLILRAESRRVPFLPLIGYRLAAFGLSYFTPGPQVGGEPLQVLYLQKNYGLTFARATSAVIMDKLLEFLANFLFLALGLAAVVQSGMLTASATQFNLALLPLLALLLWPALHIALLLARRHPISALLRLFQLHLPRRSGLAKTLRLLIVSEHLAGLFCRRHLKSLLLALGASLLVWIGMVYEYVFMLACLRAELDFQQALASLTVVRLSFLMPMPAGLGTLEASQVFAVTAFGLPAALGLSLSLLMRARDLLIGGLGLLLAGQGFRKAK
jgi:uncharacterized protein (TIRG00374 family)